MARRSGARPGSPKRTQAGTRKTKFVIGGFRPNGNAVDEHKADFEWTERTIARFDRSDSLRRDTCSRVGDFDPLKRCELEYSLDDVSNMQRGRRRASTLDLLAKIPDFILRNFGQHALLEARIDVAIVNTTPHRLCTVS